MTFLAARNNWPTADQALRSCRRRTRRRQRWIARGFAAGARWDLRQHRQAWSVARQVVSNQPVNPPTGLPATTMQRRAGARIGKPAQANFEPARAEACNLNALSDHSVATQEPWKEQAYIGNSLNRSKTQSSRSKKDNGRAVKREATRRPKAATRILPFHCSSVRFALSLEKAHRPQGRLRISPDPLAITKQATASRAGRAGAGES